MQVFSVFRQSQQGFKTVQGKSKMLPLYQVKKEQVKTIEKKHPFRVLFIVPYLYLSLYVFPVYLNAQIRL